MSMEHLLMLVGVGEHAGSSPSVWCQLLMGGTFDNRLQLDHVGGSTLTFWVDWKLSGWLGCGCRVHIIGF